MKYSFFTSWQWNFCCTQSLSDCISSRKVEMCGMSLPTWPQPGYNQQGGNNWHPEWQLFSFRMAKALSKPAISFILPTCLQATGKRHQQHCSACAFRCQPQQGLAPKAHILFVGDSFSPPETWVLGCIPGLSEKPVMKSLPQGQNLIALLLLLLF